MSRRSKLERQAKIRDIILTTEIETQKELMQRLEEAGLKSTQATVSRDISELGVIKMPLGDGRHKYTIPPKERSEKELIDKLKARFKEVVLSVDRGENDIVVVTRPAHAPEIAAAIDSLSLPEVVGTVAGDNAIIVVARNKEVASKVVDTFGDFLK